ncbi:hypothetical protein BC827DRAFT_1201264 [Russula dissimulans]|nr:hypothetical protein BC827DRAFT_1201264 [Russula dissimulans]
MGVYVDDAGPLLLLRLRPLRLELTGSSLFYRLFAITFLVVLYSSSPWNLYLRPVTFFAFPASHLSLFLLTHTEKTIRSRRLYNMALPRL